MRARRTAGRGGHVRACETHLSLVSSLCLSLSLSISRGLVRCRRSYRSVRRRASPSAARRPPTDTATDATAGGAARSEHPRQHYGRGACRPRPRTPPIGKSVAFSPRASDEPTTAAAVARHSQSPRRSMRTRDVLACSCTCIRLADTALVSSTVPSKWTYSRSRSKIVCFPMIFFVHAF